MTFNACLWCPFNVVSDGLELRPKYSGILHCMKSVWQQEGLRGLYQGVTPNVWGAGASWGLYFLLYVSDKLINLLDDVCTLIVFIHCFDLSNDPANCNMPHFPRCLPLQLQRDQRVRKGGSSD